MARAVDRNAGGEHGRTDRLTDRIGLGVLTRLVHRDLVDEVLADTGTGCSTARPPNTYKEIRDRRTVTMGMALRDIPREEGPLALSRRVCRKRIRRWWGKQ